MNNAFLKTENEDEILEITQPILRERVTQLTEIIEALNSIASSSYWTVLKQNVFDVDLQKARNRLEVEKDTTEIFRLQGEVRWGKKFSLDKLTTQYRNELETIRKKLL